MSEAKAISEPHKQRLVEHFIQEVAQGISGRDGAEVVDASPARVLFAGVLQAPRKTETTERDLAVVGASPPGDTSLGVDFRVLPDGGNSIRLTISCRWSFYYPVFPTFEQATFANPSAAQSAGTQESQLGPTGLELSQSNISENAPLLEVDQVEEQGAEDEADLEAAKETNTGTVSLPRVFRRCDVIPPPLTVEIPLEGAAAKQIGDVEIAAAISTALLSIRADPRLWKHLAQPSEAERRLGDFGTLKNPESYQKALAQKCNAPVDLPPWTVNVQIDSNSDTERPEARRIRVLLSNSTVDFKDYDGDRLLQERAIFDASVKVEIEGGHIVPFDFLLAPKDYRSKPQTAARGINCTARWRPDAPLIIASESLPLFKQPYFRTKEGLEIPFADLAVKNPFPALEGVAKEMEAYQAKWDEFLLSGRPSSWDQSAVDACRKDRDAFEKEIENYRLGIEMLRRNGKLAEAFRFMNQAFAMLGQSSGGRLRAWRLFQIGFIVSQLPALAVRELDVSESDSFASRLREMQNEVGVLWFPTGGGKTESYLGLVATALLFDRLRGKQSGVCAWMRFPLRMLSLQQLERLAKVVAILNQLRSSEPSISGGDPFAIGYYVGDGVTPNAVDQDRMRELEGNQGARDKYLLLRKCPFCGSSVEIKALRSSWRLAHVCKNATCFSNTSVALGIYKGSLPICIVDNEIYRYLPSVLVGTVDKLAIIARTRFFSHIVMGAPQRCPAHGYTSYDECIERGSWAANCSLTKKKLLPVGRYKDPGLSLLIQDELHLLRAELGVFNGHYEGLLRYLGDRAFLRPKILAATATIEAYDVHTFHVYLARSCRYPQQAWQSGESFYATSTPLKHRRFYLGVLNQTKGIEDSAVRMLALYMRAVRRLKADLSKAASIMGIPDANDADVQDTLRLYDLSLCYVNKKATGGSLSDKTTHIERFLERENNGGGIKSQFLHGDQPAEFIGNALERIERERNATQEARLDLVIATNLISHGVDLERINMMTVAGMPSHYAEYVQATSRAARSHPGIVFVCFKSRDPREHSQFEFFMEMHEHMERLIEAVAVNRFASFAPQKTVPGLLSGLLLCDYSPRLFGVDINRPLDHIPTLQIALGLKAGNQSVTSGCVKPNDLQRAIEQIIGVDKVHPPASEAQVNNVQRRVAETFEDQLGAIGRSMESKLKNEIKPITSFRDVDQGIDFGSQDSSMIVGRLRGR